VLVQNSFLIASFARVPVSTGARLDAFHPQRGSRKELMLELKGKGTCSQAINLVDRERIVRLTFTSEGMLVDGVVDHGRFVYLVARDRGGVKIFTRETAVWFAGITAGDRMVDLKITEIDHVQDQMGVEPFLTLEEALRIIKQISTEVAS
jgi:hypothetical protein